MKVLVLAPELPSPPVGGGRLRAYHFLRRLADRHDLDILCFRHDPSEAEEEERVRAWAEVTAVPWTMPAVYEAFARGEDPLAIGKASRLPFLAAYFYSPEMQRLVNERLARGGYEAVYAITSQMGQFLPEHGRVPALLDLWNLETLVARRAWERSGEEWAKLQYERMRDFEASVFARCAAILPISENERAEAYRLFAHPNAVVLENGVDTEAFAPTPIPEAPHLLFTGVMNYDPNPEAIRYFVREIFPTILAGEPRATLTVVGKNPPNDVLALDVGSGGAIRVTGFVPEVAPYFAEARVCIVPLLSGGGVRNKILEALAAGRPVVSTSLGAEGLDLEPSRHLLLADSPDAFAAATLRLLRDRDLCERMAHAGRERVVSRYDWNTLARKLDATLTACASSG